MTTGLPTFANNANRPRPGTTSRKSPRRLPTRSGTWFDRPVTLPPGRARLATRPVLTGSPVAAKTMGMTDVACLAAKTMPVPDVTITSTLRWTNSAAISAARSVRPSVQRYSTAIVRPSIKPSSRIRCTKAATHWLWVAGVPEPKYPMVGSFAGCCPRAASGQAAAPPNSAMNSRRSFDYLVGKQKERVRDREPNCFRGLEVDGQLEFDRLLHGQVGGLGALQDLVHVPSRAPEQVRLARAVGHQSPGAHVLAQLIHCRQPVLRHEVHDPCDTDLVDWFGGHPERIGALLHHCCECGLELDARTYANGDDRHT